MVIERANTMRGSRNICCPFSPPGGENNGVGGRIMSGEGCRRGGACCSKYEPTSPGPMILGTGFRRINALTGDDITIDWHGRGNGKALLLGADVRSC